MNYRNVSLVGSIVLSSACLSLSSCSNNGDGVMLAGSGGSAGKSSSAVGGLGGVTSSGGNSSSATGGTIVSTGTGGSGQGGQVATGGETASSGGTSGEGGAAAGGTSTSIGGTGTAGTGTAGSSAAGAAGTTTGGAGAAGASSVPVVPTRVTGADYRFALTACSNVTMDVNPQIGARVTSLTLGSTSIITPYTCTAYDPNASCPNNAGSTFWTSPQSAWDGNTSTTGDWPPVSEVDGGAYTASISAANHLVAVGSTNAALGASVTKDFSADAGNCWITLLYTIKATKSIQIAPWEITRVPRGGIAFFPLGTTVAAGPLSTYTVTNTTTTPSVVWFDDSSKAASNATVNGSNKLVADGANGWLAYALGGNLFIKKYSDVQTAAIAPNEGDVEIYADPSGYLELEVQGAYSSLASAATLPWTVQWRIVPIPSSVTVASGSSSLLTFVQQQVAM